MSPRPSRTYLANLVSDVMAEAPTPAYRRAMAAVTPRKLWQARPGDCIVVLAPVTPDFRDYVARTIGLDVDEVEIVAPPELRGVHALDVAREAGALARIGERPDLQPFALDAPVREFARSAGLRVLPYSQLPSESTLAAVRAINTKDFFRSTAAGLGLPVADGGHAGDPAALTEALRTFLTDHAAAIVKRNRGSNGFGNTVVRADDARGLEEQVRLAVGDQPAPSGWIYEEFLDLTGVPSMEMLVGDDGVEEFYSCDQRSVNNAWTGMVTPAEPGPFDAELLAAAMTIGRWLFEQGYRGIYDVDCGVHAGGYVVTEANVRRTGGTYLEELARLLLPGPGTRHWRADARPGPEELDFGTAVKRLDAAGLSDPDADVRVVLTADTLPVDQKRRYLVVGREAEAVAEVERQVVHELGIA